MTRHDTALDFSRSYCFYVPEGHSIWVRIQAECRCEIIDVRTQATDEYILGVRTQTGLRTTPPSDELDPGYDFWMTFSREYLYVKRNHASSHTNNPTRVPVEDFIETGWHLEQAPARRLEDAGEMLDALKRGCRLTAKTTFTGSGGVLYRTEYPIKWADADPIRHEFRVETGPVLLVDPDHVAVGTPVAFDDFLWAYLDVRGFDDVRCLIEQPTSIFTGALYHASSETPRRHAALTEDQLQSLKRWIFEHPDAPLGPDVLTPLLETNHYSRVEMRSASTAIFSLDD